LNVNGPSCGNSSGAGSGGRIAVMLSSGTTFGNVTNTAYGATGGNPWQFSSAGTVYLQKGGQTAGRGTLFVNNNNLNTSTNPGTCTQLPVPNNPPAQLPGLTLVITNRGQLALTTNLALKDLYLYTNSILYLKGFTLTLNSPYHADWGETNRVVYAGGAIIWGGVETYTLTYSAGPGGTISGTTPQTVAYGGNGSAVTAAPGAGYRFVDWSDGVNTATRTDTNVAGNLSVTANFAPDTHALTVTSGTGGGSYTNGTVVNITANGAPPGQVFDAWVVNSGSPVIANTNAVATTLTMPATDVTVTATYKAASYTLSVTNGGGGGLYTSGTVVNIVANAPPVGQSFGLWVVNSGGAVIANVNAASTLLTMPAANASVTALYQGPYFGTNWPIPGRIEAENYDLGGEGIAYHDSNAGNFGGAYRTDNVDLEGTADGFALGTTTNYNVGWTVAGEWLEYSANVVSNGTYDVTFRVAGETAYTNGTFHLAVDGVNVSGPMPVPDTGGWQTFINLMKPGVALTAGTHVLRLSFDTDLYNNGNINWLEFTAATTVLPWPVITVVATGGNLSLQVGTVSGATYVLESATNLWPQPIDWAPIATNGGTGGPLTNTVPVDAGTPRRFFRYQVR